MVRGNSISALCTDAAMPNVSAAADTTLRTSLLVATESLLLLIRPVPDGAFLAGAMLTLLSDRGMCIRHRRCQARAVSSMVAAVALVQDSDGDSAPAAACEEGRERRLGVLGLEAGGELLALVVQRLGHGGRPEAAQQALGEPHRCHRLAG